MGILEKIKLKLTLSTCVKKILHFPAFKFLRMIYLPRQILFQISFFFFFVSNWIAPLLVEIRDFVIGTSA